MGDDPASFAGVWEATVGDEGSDDFCAELRHRMTILDSNAGVFDYVESWTTDDCAPPSECDFDVELSETDIAGEIDMVFVDDACGDYTDYVGRCLNPEDGVLRCTIDSKFEGVLEFTETIVFLKT